MNNEDKIYCSQCGVKLNKAEARAKIESVIEDAGHGSPVFRNKSKYYCPKHTPNIAK